MQTLKETIYIHNGKGIISIQGNEKESILFFNKQPFSLTFHVELGTLWRYHLGKPIDKNFFLENYLYQNLVRQGNIKSKISLHEQFNHITSLLTNGNYELSISNYDSSFSITNIIMASDGKNFIDDYGRSMTLIATQAYMNNSIVEQYKTQISQGFQPIAVLLKTKNSYNEFIIDGHHKIHAYKQLKYSPKVLTIEKLETKNIKYSKGTELIKRLNISDSKLIQRYKELHEESF